MNRQGWWQKGHMAVETLAKLHDVDKIKCRSLWGISLEWHTANRRKDVKRATLTLKKEDTKDRRWWRRATCPDDPPFVGSRREKEGKPRMLLHWENGQGPSRGIHFSRFMQPCYKISFHKNIQIGYFYSNRRRRWLATWHPSTIDEICGGIYLVFRMIFLKWQLSLDVFGRHLLMFCHFALFLKLQVLHQPQNRHWVQLKYRAIFAPRIIWLVKMFHKIVQIAPSIARVSMGRRPTSTALCQTTWNAG